MEYFLFQVLYIPWYVPKVVYTTFGGMYHEATFLMAWSNHSRLSGRWKSRMRCSNLNQEPGLDPLINSNLGHCEI
jgi:hypothetical protein